MGLTSAKPALRRLLRPVERFLATESASGIVLIAAALVAFAWANSPWAALYAGMQHIYAGFHVGSFGLELSLAHWVNDALMALFFFVVGLEIKRELLVGELAGWQRAALPAVGALGGMVVPAAHLCLAQPRPARHRRLGRADGDRHRVRGRDPGASGPACAAGAQGLPAGAGHRRRPGCRPRDRRLLHARPRHHGFGSGRTRLARSTRLWPRRRLAPHRLSAAGRGPLVLHLQVGRACDRGGRAPGAGDPARAAPGRGQPRSRAGDRARRRRLRGHGIRGSNISRA